ncbi:MAG: YciI family protein [Acidobacteriota bacterium]
MKFMMIVKADAASESGAMPDMELVNAMGKFNEEMVKAGVMLAGEGLQASSKGARVIFKPGQKPYAVDGPFAETKELIAGFWMIQVKSKEEAVAWALRIPAPHGANVETNVEIRQVFDSADFGPEVEAQENALRAEMERQAKK